MPLEFGPIRAIKDDLIVSPTAPRLAVRFAPTLIYIGDLQYIRRETYYVEEFIMINTNGLGHMTQMLLVHFAGLLENQAGAFAYPASPTLTLAGDVYHLDQFTIPLVDGNDKHREGEVARAVDYIRQRAYTLPGDLACQRFRRLVSEDGRREFALLYAEPASTALPLERDENGDPAPAAADAAHPEDLPAGDPTAQGLSLEENALKMEPTLEQIPAPAPVTPESLLEHALKAFEIIKE